MYRVELYLRVRRACMVDGMGIREASGVFGLYRDTVRKMLAHSVPPGYRRRKPPTRPKIGPYTGVIDRILEDDPVSSTGQALNLPRKQHHTAKRIHERLREEYGFDGGYTIVDYVRKHRRRTREMFVPLVHPPGHAQCDFGEAWVVIGGVKQKIHFFVLDLPHSDAMFVRAYPAETTEALCDGHVSAFSFLGECRRVSCTTTPGLRWPGYWETVADSAPGLSPSLCRTTFSRTGSVVPARATTRGRWRVWSGTPDATSLCPSRRLRASIPYCFFDDTLPHPRAPSFRADAPFYQVRVGRGRKDNQGNWLRC